MRTLVAGLIEEGADPLPVLDLLVDRVTTGLEQAARFPALAERMGGLPDPPGSAAEAAAWPARIKSTE